MDFRAGPAGAGIAHLPKVVFLIESEDSVPRHDLGPEFFRLIILAKDRGIEFGRRDTEVLRHQLPGPGNGFLLEVVTEGEVAEHFEEGVMTRGAPDLFEVVVLAAGAHALLGGASARVVAPLAAQEDVLELVHAGVREEQRRVVRRHQRRGAHDAMGTFLEEL